MNKIFYPPPPIRGLTGRLLASLLLAICALINPHDAAAEKVLKVTGWDVYGDPEQPGKTIGYKSFEEKTGVRIEFFPFSNLDDIVSAAESDRNYDLFLISNEGIEILYDMDLAIPLELTKIPHYANQHPNLKYSEWSQFNSRVYAVPWAWGPTGLLYDTEAVTKPGSWNALWDPAFKGKVSMWDDVSMIWTAALALGYKNVYNLTRKQLKAVEAKLFAFNDQAALYYKGGGNDMEAAMKGGLVALNSWYDPSARLKTAGQHFHMIIPKEGAVGMFDSFMVSSRSDNKALAHEYINHQISPPIQREMVQVTGLAPANMETLALLDSHMIEELNLDDPDYFSRMLLWDHMPRKNLYEKVLQAVRADWKRKKTAQ